MSLEPLPSDLQEFIGRYIRSVEQLEILCLFVAEPNRGWTVAEIFRQIQSSERSVAECLQEFVRCELLNRDTEGRYYFPREAGASALALELYRCYRERRVTVVETIYRKPAAPAQDFSDAFLFRKKK